MKLNYGVFSWQLNRVFAHLEDEGMKGDSAVDRKVIHDTFLAVSGDVSGRVD